MTVLGLDGKKRCFGGQAHKEIYGNYHDQEWGKPVYDDQHLFEMLVLEGAQAGLSWETVLSKRDAYRKFFHAFDPTKVAMMTDLELNQLILEKMLIRNRLKIYSARCNAIVFLKIQKEHGQFSQYLWEFVNHKPIYHPRDTWKEIPTQSVESQKLSTDLKQRGMTFVGPTIMYAYMQAVGLVNDHLTKCWCHTSL